MYANFACGILSKSRKRRHNGLIKSHPTQSTESDSLSDSVLCRHTVVPTFKVDDFCTRTGDYSIYVFHSSRISGPFSSTKTETC